jgi:hypothetical protein
MVFPIHWDGHEISAFTTFATSAWLANRCMYDGWWKSLIHRQPAMAAAIAFAGVGMVGPLIVPRIRRQMGLPTNQYDAHNPDMVLPNYDRFRK